MNKMSQNIRKGQEIFNFLEWLKQEKGYSGNENHRMADPFSIADKDWDSLLKEYRSNHE